MLFLKAWELDYRMVRLKSMKKLWVLLLGLVITSCGAEENVTSVDVVPEKLVTVSESGGCYQAGFNCFQYVLWDDGTLVTYRFVGNGETELEESFTASDEFLNEWDERIKEADFGDIRSNLGEGFCNGCVDGIDYTVKFTEESFDSATNDLDDDPIFAIVDELQAEARTQRFDPAFQMR